MTIFGIDVSHHQGSIDLRTVASDSRIDFAFAKLTEGRGFRDPSFPMYADQARETDLLFAAYHFLRGDSSPIDQAVNVSNALKAAGVPETPVVIDLERTNGSPQPHMIHAREFRNACAAIGVHVPTLLYLPEWYWAEIGRPDTNGWSLWQSDYGSNNGVYPGDDSSRWVAMGRQAAVLQYTSNGSVPGYSGPVDLNAYRGTREELASMGWFTDHKEHVVATKEEIQAWVATTPIVVDGAGTKEPLQKVLRQILNKPVASGGATAEEIAAAVVAALPADDVDLTKADVKEALVAVLRQGTG